MRVKISIKCGNKEIVTSALVNSGFESNEPEIIIPLEVAKRLGLWPPVSVEYAEYETAGGIITLPRYKNIAEIRLILEDKETKPIKCTLTVNPEVSEVFSIINLKKSLPIYNSRQEFENFVTKGQS